MKNWISFKILFIYCWETQRKRHRQRKRLPYRGPDARLDPRTLGSRPEPKANAQLLSHPGAPRATFNERVLQCIPETQRTLAIPLVSCLVCSLPEAWQPKEWAYFLKNKSWCFRDLLENSGDQMDKVYTITSPVKRRWENRNKYLLNS